jgi:DNA (cytosine-5)-methyltransferase 1
MRYGSVCSGIEAATMAWHPLGWTPAFFSEIEAFPSAVLAHHYGSNMPGEPLAKNGIPNYGDFTTIGPDAGPIDLLVGGTPCQSFSVAGKRLGLDDPRGNLALEYLALARRLRARWIVWENVPGVLSSHTDDEQGEEDEGDDGLESADFATFLSFVQECGYGYAYRVLDAQYVRVDHYARAVPQRRRRVFLVGYLGDWRRAAAVLLEPEGMRGDPAPRREAGQRAAPTIASRPTGGGGLGTDFDLDGGLIAKAFGGNNQSGPIDVATAVNAHGGPMGRMDFESETFVAHPLLAKANSSHDETLETYVAHALRAEGFDASGDGTGRGTPIVPVPLTLAIRGRDGEPDIEWRQDGTANAILTPNGGRAGMGVGAIAAPIAFNPKLGSNPTYGLGVNPEETSYTLDANGHSTAVAFSVSQNANGFAWESEVNPTLQARAQSESANQIDGIRQGWAVRRLMPIECERLQGFPDNFTNVPWRGKDHAPDGPRYKALGNSMACNAMRWIGQRIDIMEKLIKAGRIQA